MATNRIIDASFGYFIMPILSVFLGYVFFKEKLNPTISANLEKVFKVEMIELGYL